MVRARPGRGAGARARVDRSEPPGPRRYPVILRRFELRQGSGGRGRFRGGDGVVRELLFREEALLSVLTERRAFRPYGLHGERQRPWIPDSRPTHPLLHGVLPSAPPSSLPSLPLARSRSLCPPAASAPPVLAFRASLTLPLPAGGEPGARGLNLLIRKDGRTVNLGGKTSVPVFPGVRIDICPSSFPSALQRPPFRRG